MGSPEKPPREQGALNSAPKNVERLEVVGETKQRLNLLWQQILTDGDKAHKQLLAESEERQEQGFLSQRDSSDALERARAASVLPFGHQEHWLLPLLPKLFSDPDPRVRTALIENLFIRDRPALSTLYEPLFHDPSPSVRIAIINDWFTILWHRPDLIALYLTDKSEEVRAAMVRKWYPFMDHVDLVRGLSADPSSMVRNALRQNPRLLSLYPVKRHQKRKDRMPEQSRYVSTTLNEPARP